MGQQITLYSPTVLLNPTSLPPYNKIASASTKAVVIDNNSACAFTFSAFPGGDFDVQPYYGYTIPVAPNSQYALFPYLYAATPSTTGVHISETSMALPYSAAPTSVAQQVSAGTATTYANAYTLPPTTLYTPFDIEAASGTFLWNSLILTPSSNATMTVYYQTSPSSGGILTPFTPSSPAYPANAINLRSTPPAPTIRDAYTSAVTLGVTSINVTIPSNTQVGDELLLMVFITGNATTTVSPLSFTPIQDRSINGYNELTLFRRVAQSGDAGAGLTLSFSTSISVMASVIAIANGTYDGSAIQSSATTPMYMPGYSITSPNNLVIAGVIANGSVTAAPVSPFSLQIGNVAIGSQYAEANEGVLQTGNNTSSYYWTDSNTTNPNNCTAVVVYRPATGRLVLGTQGSVLYSTTLTTGTQVNMNWLNLLGIVPTVNANGFVMRLSTDQSMTVQSVASKIT